MLKNEWPSSLFQIVPTSVHCCIRGLMVFKMVIYEPAGSQMADETNVS
ncbi:hypothetical protein [Methanoplanus endosymbiosus]|uniref:Uncharacterized protein n=1 Tax=Methanoplanus endosymbiosus TaxID=33865 RepID=A0A9E7PKN1_9EURY|nr:hypothetical protein [Methanoplanus endosymbiosus]UUX91833.1 hypothetical protein L6E24_10740 [Methanoplanus endosymbiosus]